MTKSANKAGRLAVAKTYKIYIGGKFPRTESARYYTLEDKKGNVIANVCRGSRKDFRNAMVAARSAQAGGRKPVPICVARFCTVLQKCWKVDASNSSASYAAGCCCAGCGKGSRRRD